MTFFQSFLFIASIVSGFLVTILVLFSHSEDRGIMSTPNQFAPGTFDSSRNIIIAVFASIFAISILGINAISVRSKKNLSYSNIDSDIKKEISIDYDDSKPKADNKTSSAKDSKKNQKNKSKPSNGVNNSDRKLDKPSNKAPTDEKGKNNPNLDYE